MKKLNQIEKAVKALTRKVLELEKETTKLKTTETGSKDVKGIGNSEIIKEKQMNDKTNISDNNFFNPIGSSSPKDKITGSQPKEKRYSDKKTAMKEDVFDVNDIKEKCSTPKEKNKKVSNEEALLSCKECTYKCKKINSLKKHITLKHEKHPCKECQESHPSVTELLKHIAKKHCEEEGDVLVKGGEVQDLDEDKLIKRSENIKTMDSEEKYKSFVFSESKFFDEFL